MVLAGHGDPARLGLGGKGFEAVKSKYGAASD